MARKLLRDVVLLDPEGTAPVAGALLLEEGRIAARLRPEEPPPEGAEVVEGRGRAVAPGFLDLHYHGSLVFREPAEGPAALRRAAAEALRHGVTGFLPTTVAWPAPELMTRVTFWADAASSASSEGAAVLGLHLEGPWIRPEAAGAQPRKGIRSYDPAEGRRLLDRGHGLIRMVTLAPEIAGAGTLLGELGRRGVVAALGHSLAPADACERALAAGASHVTHLFNAMGPLHHRELGLAGVALGEDALSCDLICDGVHVHPSVVRIAARAKGEGLVLITDRLEPATEADPSESAPRPSFGSGSVRDDGSAWRLPDGRLAGSTLTLDRAVRHAVAFGAMTRLEAVAAVTLRPARVLGLERERGTLRPGARADLVLLDDEGAVVETWIAGEPRYRAATPGTSGG